MFFKVYHCISLIAATQAEGGLVCFFVIKILTLFENFHTHPPTRESFISAPSNLAIKVKHTWKHLNKANYPTASYKLAYAGLSLAQLSPSLFFLMSWGSENTNSNLCYFNEGTRDGSCVLDVKFRDRPYIVCCQAQFQLQFQSNLIELR